MIRFSRRAFEVVTAILVGLVPVILYTGLFDDEIPPSVPGDIDARVYPDALVYLWFGLSAAHIVEALFGYRGERVAIRRDELAHVAKIVLIIGCGFVILTQVGYLTAGFFYIVAFAHILNERGPAVWIMAAAVPTAVYVFLRTTLDVRLPTILDLWR